MKIHHYEHNVGFFFFRGEHNVVKHLNSQKLLIFLILSVANMDYEINSLIIYLQSGYTYTNSLADSIATLKL